MLLTEGHIARVNSLYLPQPDRKKKVKRSMAAIKCVLGEREREVSRAEKDEKQGEIY